MSEFKRVSTRAWYIYVHKAFLMAAVIEAVNFINVLVNPRWRQEL